MFKKKLENDLNKLKHQLADGPQEDMLLWLIDELKKEINK